MMERDVMKCCDMMGVFSFLIFWLLVFPRSFVCMLRANGDRLNGVDIGYA
jgi:hypothetical protein